MQAVCTMSVPFHEGGGGGIPPQITTMEGGTHPHATTAILGKTTRTMSRFMETYSMKQACKCYAFTEN